MARTFSGATLGVVVALALGCAGGADQGPSPLPEAGGPPPASDGPVSTDRDQGPPPPDPDGGEPPPLPRDTGVPPKDTKAPEPDQGGGFNCGPRDSECGSGSYMKACTDGTCFGTGCCCPESQKCRAGSFPVCCDAGKTCQNTATGECG